VSLKMSFYLSTKGVLHPFEFRYLKGDFEKARLEPTLISNHDHSRDVKPTTTNKDLFAIDIMNNPVKSMNAGTSLEDIRNLMQKENIRHIPITDQKKFVGMISDRDLLKVDMSGTFAFLKARDFMSTVVIIATEEVSLAHIARVLLEEKISALPVVNKSLQLTGMITRSDILKAVIYNRLVLK